MKCIDKVFIKLWWWQEAYTVNVRLQRCTLWHNGLTPVSPDVPSRMCTFPDDLVVWWWKSITKTNWLLTSINLLFILAPAKDQEEDIPLVFIFFIFFSFCVSLIPSAFASSILLKRDFCGSASDCDLALFSFTICRAKRWTLSSGHAASGSQPRLSELQLRVRGLVRQREHAFFFAALSCIPLDLNRVELCARLSIGSRPRLTRWQLLWMTFNPNPYLGPQEVIISVFPWPRSSLKSSNITLYLNVRVITCSSALLSNGKFCFLVDISYHIGSVFIRHDWLTELLGLWHLKKEPGFQ